MTMDGKVALVTGAGSGIGKASALMLAEHGAKVACLSRTESQLQQVVAEIEEDGGEAHYIAADISQAEQMRSAIGQVIDRWGRLDIVVANASINGVWAPLDELEPDEWDETMNINLKGTFLTVKYAVPYLKKRGGSVVVVSSVNGTRKFSNTGGTAYASSKAGQLAFTKIVALELASHDVRVNCICPGFTQSEIGDNTILRNRESVVFPVIYPNGSVPLTGGKPASGEQVAKLVCFLTSDAASHITGTEMWIDGGQTLVQG